MRAAVGSRLALRDCVPAYFKRFPQSATVAAVEDDMVLLWWRGRADRLECRWMAAEFLETLYEPVRGGV